MKTTLKLLRGTAAVAAAGALFFAVGGGPAYAEVATLDSAMTAVAPTRLLAAANPRVDIPVPDMAKYITEPTCDSAGSLSFLDNPPAQNPNGYEFPGQGFRVYIKPAFNGAGTYEATIQKLGPASYDTTFPGGTKLIPGGLPTIQSLTVLGAKGYQSTDPTAECYKDATRPVVEEIVGGCTSGPITINATDEYALKRVVGNIYDETGKTLIKSFQASASGASGSLTIDPSILPPGKYTLKYNTQDGAGNTSITKTVAIKTDCVRPAVTVNTADAKCMGSVTATFNDNAVLDYAVINLYKANGTFVKTLLRQNAINSSEVTLTASLAGLGMGDYYVKAAVYDVAGNNGTTASATFTISCS